MAEMRTYPEGTPFTGEIGRTASESTAAWPVPPRAKAGVEDADPEAALRAAFTTQ